MVTSKHAYWQFLPDKLISPFFLPELLDNLPSVKARQKGPLPCSDLAVPARQAHSLWQTCRPSICMIMPPPSGTDPFPSPWGPWGSIRNTSLPLLWKSLRLGTGPWPLVPREYARVIKLWKPRTGRKFGPGRCLLDFT